MEEGMNNWGCGGVLMWVLVIFALMGGGGFGGFGNRAGLTQAEMQQGFNHQDTQGQLRGISYGLADSAYSLNNAILQGQNNLEKTVMQGNNGLGMAIMGGNNGLEKNIMQTGYGISQQLNNNRFEQQNCCCEQKQLILQNMANNDKNTCELKTAIHAEGEATRAMIANNQIQDLREKIADKDRELQTANFNLSQVAQSAAIVGKISPRPVPAYMTASPYQSLYGCGGVMV